jgi:hypothetical protein
MAVMQSVIDSVLLEPVVMALPQNLNEALIDCAKGEIPPEIALMQLLLLSISEDESERALGTAIWNALENRDVDEAERLGVMQKLWDFARDTVQTASTMSSGRHL